MTPIETFKERTREDFLKYTQVVTEDGQKVPFTPNRVQRILLQKFRQNIEDGKLLMARWPIVSSTIFHSQENDNV